MSNGNRGKYSEEVFKKAVLDVHCVKATEKYIKLPDAYTGSKKEVPADFLWQRNGQLHLVEVKSLAATPYRLPYYNFPPEQVARLRLWSLTGAICWVAIHHSSLQGAQWRKIPAEYFFTRNPDKPAGSWNLEQFPLIYLNDWDAV